MALRKQSSNVVGAGIRTDMNLSRSLLGWDGPLPRFFGFQRNLVENTQRTPRALRRHASMKFTSSVEKRTSEINSF